RRAGQVARATGRHPAGTAGMGRPAASPGPDWHGISVRLILLYKPARLEGVHCGMTVLADQQTGVYVPVSRSPGLGRRRLTRLLGPYASEAEAQARIGDARRLACRADKFAAFGAFGVTRMTKEPGSAPLPAGVLNAALAEAQG